MAADMISLAWVENYDAAVSVFSDHDFVPAAEFLETRDVNVVHGATSPQGAQLTRSRWGRINV